MVNAYISENNKIVNIVVADNEQVAIENGWLVNVVAQIGWELDNGVWSAPAVVVTVPLHVTSEQAKRAMSRTTHGGANLYDTVKTIVNALPDSHETKITYNNATVWYRDNGVISDIAQTIALSNTDMDNLFILAGTI